MTEEKKYEEEERYTKVDKRVTRDAPDAPEPEEDAATEQTPAAEESATPSEPPAEGADQEAASDAQSLADVGVFGVLRFCVSLLTQQAWLALGVLAPPGGETKENLPEAKIAIDTLAVIVEGLTPDLDDDEKRELDGVLANLRANYVARSG